MPQAPILQRLKDSISDSMEMSLSQFSEAEILSHSAELAESQVFGDLTELFLSEWHNLDEPASTMAFICLGIRRNADRDAFVHATDAVAEAGVDDLKPLVIALDRRVSDDDSSALIRVEALACLVRLSLQDPRWLTFATAGLIRLLEVDDGWVRRKLCRLAAILSDQLSWDDAVKHLSSIDVTAESAVDLNQELGFLEMTAAFRCPDSAGMGAHLLKSAERFRACERWSEDAHRPRMYATVTELLARKLLYPDKPISLDIASLKLDATSVALYRVPRAGSEWLFPPGEAELEWIPLLAHLSAGHDEIDPIVLFSDVVKLFAKVRAVQTIADGVKEYRGPGRLSSATEHGLLMGNLRQFLRSSDCGVSPEGRTQVESNLDAFGKPPGKF